MPAPANIVHELSSTTGTGNFTLVNVNGKNNFNDAFGTGGSDVFDYFISHQSAAEWERGTGHMSDAATLVRDSVIESTNADAAVDFSAGTKDVINDVPAAIQLRTEGGQTLTGTLTFPNTGLHILDTGGDHDYIIAPGENATADRTLTLDLNDADRTLDLTGNTTLAGGTHSGTNTGDEDAASIRGIGFFDTSNDGTGSGLDADLLDGNHASAFEAADADILKADVGDTLTAGYLSDSYAGGTQSSGTYTPAPATGQENIQHIVNGGAFTLAPPANPCTVLLQIINNGSAGTITTSSFDVVAGDSFDTTDTNAFLCFIAVSNDYSYLNVVAMQ
jgi:hypothetical protein